MNSFEEYPHFFEVHLDLFQGPIDLLLHLVKQNELPIEKVSLAQVTEQYLGALEDMRRFDLEVAGEYLVIAATLVSLKSSLLLNEPAPMVEDEDGNMVDPHEELLRRLREAEVYKEGADLLEQRGQLGIDVFAPPSSLRRVGSAPVTYRDHDPTLLGQAFHRLLKEAAGSDGAVYEVTLESVSIVERMMGVLEILRENDSPVEFRSLIPDLTSRGSIIGTFIALLELCKRQVIGIHQGEEEESIYIGLSSTHDSESLDTMALASEFDVSTAAAVVGGESVV